MTKRERQVKAKLTDELDTNQFLELLDSGDQITRSQIENQIKKLKRRCVKNAGAVTVIGLLAVGFDFFRGNPLEWFDFILVGGLVSAITGEVWNFRKQKMALEMLKEFEGEELV